jgi:hypothetical protein
VGLNGRLRAPFGLSSGSKTARSRRVVAAYSREVPMAHGLRRSIDFLCTREFKKRRTPIHN